MQYFLRNFVPSPSFSAGAELHININDIISWVVYSHVTFLTNVIRCSSQWGQYWCSWRDACLSVMLILPAPAWLLLQLLPLFMESKFVLINLSRSYKLPRISTSATSLILLGELEGILHVDCQNKSKQCKDWFICLSLSRQYSSFKHMV